jgi:hypothetical protein
MVNSSIAAPMANSLPWGLRCYTLPFNLERTQTLAVQNLLLGLQYGGIPSINSLQSIYNFQVIHIFPAKTDKKVRIC